MRTIYTIGHSTRILNDLIKTLQHYKIKNLVDVRHFPHSRHNPQFNKENLGKELPKHEINYIWLEQLGGFRKGGYKNYTKTPEFLSALKKLEKIDNCAIMCAELLWFKCHRRYIADVLKRCKYKVVHIFDKNKFQEHKITKKSKVRCDKKL